MKTKYKLFFLFVTLTFVSQSWCQLSDTTIRIGTRISCSYLSSLIYPGFSVGLEIPLRAIDKIKVKKDDKKLIMKERFFSTDLNLYHQVGFHTNIFLTGSYCLKRINQKGYYLGAMVGVGISRTILGGTTYVMDDNGNVKVKHGAGNFYFAILTGATLGRDFYYSKWKKNFQLFLRPSLLLLMPYSSTIYPKVNLELGVKFGMPDFMKHSVKKVTKIKTL